MNQQPEGSPFGDSTDRPPPDGRPPRRRVAQFSFAKMMLVLTVATTAAAPLAYLTRALHGDRKSHFVFIIFCLAAPALLLIVVSAIYQLRQWLGRFRRP